MKKIGLIIAREYITRVRKRSFIIMTIIGPILIAALFIVPAWISQLEDTELKTIAVIDETFTFSDALNDSKYIKFINIENTNIEQEKKSFKETDYYALLYLPHNILNSRRIQIFSDKDVTLSVKMHISNQVTKEIERQKLRSENIDEDILKRIKTDLDVQTIKWTAEGEERESFTELKMVLGFAVGFMIYMFIFMYGSQVMRGVIEEKTNRIIEVIVSSVKPFQLMMGKIVGVAFVGLTQFILWVALSTTLVSVAKLALFEAPELGQQEIVVENILTQENANDLLPTGNEETEELADMLTTVIQSVDWTLMIFSFVIFFLGGYLLYSSMFAAVGSAVDNETDTQQFMLPITIPLILSIILIQNIINSPDGPIAFWFSMIPFTSPIIMMTRIPFGVAYWEVGLSIVILIITFIVSTWFAGKIYRTGILMYGKKISYKEIWKWVRYKN